MLAQRFLSPLGLAAPLPASGIPYLSDLDAPLLRLSPHKRDLWTLRHAFEGVHVFGGTGSGKTSGSGRALAHAYLRAGMGGIVLTAKPGEYELWRRYAAETGRSAHLIRFSPDSGFRFNFLDYAIAASEGAGRRVVTSNLVNLLMKMTEAAQRGSELRGQAAEQPFWRLAPRELIDHTIDALFAAYGTLRLSDMIEFVLTLPKFDARQPEATFGRTSFAERTLLKAGREPVHPLPAADLNAIASYFRFNYGLLDEKTRSNIVVTMTSQFNPLMKGMMREIFSTWTTIVPELTHEGAIIIVDFPVKEYEDAGMLAQHIFKYLWQRATESRDPRRSQRPVFCWADEAQFFITPYDIHFQTTARSSRAATVYLTQTFSNYYASIGGANPRDATHAFLANFVTKIFHANTDHNTNQAAADMIGKRVQIRGGGGRSSSNSQQQSFGENDGISFSQSSGVSWSRDSGVSTSSSSGRSSQSGRSIGLSIGDTLSHSTSWSEQMDYDIQPGDFAALRSGGPANGGRTDAVFFQGGRGFAACGGRNYMTLSFQQG
jgi:hypothetical protein